MERMVYKGFSLVVLLTVLQTGKGEDYLVAVAYRGNDSYISYRAGETGGLVEIKYPHFAYRTSRQLGPFLNGSHLIGDKMQITSAVENAVIVVSASDEEIDIVVDADGVFVPLPVSALGTKYILPSGLAPVSGYRSLLLIATHKMSTTVDIFFRMNRGSIDFTNHRYSDGDVLSLKLNPYQTLRMSTPYDLNGTVINSEHSVAVYSGIEYASDYTVYDQLLPIKHYGQEYVVAVDDTKLELQIISEHSHVQITFSSGATVSTGDRRVYNRSLERGESLHFTATSPILVTLSRADGYSSSFTTVPPVHSYVTHRSLWLYRNGLRLNLKILTDTRATVNDRLTWRGIAGSNYKVGTLVQSQSRHSFTFISSDFPFTVLSFYNGSVYNSGYKVSVDEPVHYTGPTYLVALAKGKHGLNPLILASAWENGGQWRIQDPNSRFRVWSRCFNPYNTDYFYPIVQAYAVILVLVLVRDDAVQIKGNLDFYAWFSPLPVTALGTKYIMSSCRTPNYMSVLLIATHSKWAGIDIIFRLEGYVAYKGREYTNGDTLRITLYSYQTFSLNSKSDMTGTIVMSTETLAVYSGTYTERYDVFNTFEQLLPVKHYGNEYIFSIHDYDSRRYSRTSSYQLQVVTDHSDTSIMFDDGDIISVGEVGVYRKEYGHLESFYFNTTRPAMATLCANKRLGSAAGLVVVPPVSLYSKLTTQEAPGTMQILTDQENNNVDVQQIHDTGSTVFIPPVTWKNLSGTRYKVGTLRGSSYTTTTIRSNSTFAVLGYYYKTIYNGGYSFRTYRDTENSAPDEIGNLNTSGMFQDKLYRIIPENSAPDGNGSNLNTSGMFQADSPNNAAVIVGVVCGIVIVALLVAFAAYVFYTRRKMKPVAEQGADAPSISRNIYAEPDIVAGGAAGEDTCMETYI
ncbi:uncharacterized protein LOC124283914 [Haliotis rubra]|uniref:uncharacterized protein LOC124283914 n=1 Tax=Haliotis rubra TaxID=36100 RepID=UPI001EE52EDF|nr:uncharacterized protein LOC124283914 [Haliotis rubra]